jgi:putative endonuclease
LSFYVLHLCSTEFPPVSEFYTGFTRELKLRFEQHNKGRVESTKTSNPLQLVYYEACINEEDAIRPEKYLKTYLGKMFLKKRLKSYLTG